MSDFLSLLIWFRNTQRRMQEVSELFLTMRREGRETMTDAEKAKLQSDDDDARDQLMEAIEASEGR